MILSCHGVGNFGKVGWCQVRCEPLVNTARRSSFSKSTSQSLGRAWSSGHISLAFLLVSLLLLFPNIFDVFDVVLSTLFVVATLEMEDN